MEVIKIISVETKSKPWLFNEKESIHHLNVIVELSNNMDYEFTFEKDAKEGMTDSLYCKPLLWMRFEINSLHQRETLCKEYKLTDQKTKEIAQLILEDKKVKLKALFLKETKHSGKRRERLEAKKLPSTQVYLSKDEDDV